MLLVLGVISGCGSSNDDTATSNEASTEADGNGNGNNEQASSEAGDVDCEAMIAALTTLGVGVQILAQLKTQSQYDLLNDDVLAFDPDEFDAAIVALAPLATVDNPLGSVSDSFALYSEANELARQNLAVDDPFTQAKGNELAALNEDLAAFLGAQIPISYARGELGC